MRRHRKKKRQQADVALNLAAMLDMAFQLLAFFILTFRPAPMEGQIKLMLPPPNRIDRQKFDRISFDIKNRDVISIIPS